MSVPTWSEGLDDEGFHREIFDRKLAEALPHPDEDSITGYHPKLVAESKGKLMTVGKDKKLRRTALGAGLLKDQKRVSDAVRKFNGAREMKKTAGTKARAGGVTGAGIMYAVADGPSPQNINPVRREVTSDDIHNTTNYIDVPARVARLVEDKFLMTVEDCKELGGDNNKGKQTLPFVTHGVITLACDAKERAEMKIGDRVYASQKLIKFHTNDNEQFNITSDRGTVAGAGDREANSKRIGYYLGPASDRPNGGIVIRLDVER